MPITVATHSGPFHADDVLAWALIRVFHDADAALIRTRDEERLAGADIVFDVGGLYDLEALRFDHHQQSYQGPLSSAGMVLAWLEASGQLTAALASELRATLVDYVDAVDNGRRTPDPGVPCFPTIVGVLNHPASTMEEFDRAFRQAGELACAMVEGIVAGHRARLESAAAIRAAMADAERRQSNIIVLDQYRKWKEVYFDHGGIEHPTEFVVHPGVDGRWRGVAIPPERNSFAQKRSFPESWAGLRDAELEAATGVDGAVFCHKNRFIAVFHTREQLIEAMTRFGLVRGEV